VASLAWLICLHLEQLFAIQPSSHNVGSIMGPVFNSVWEIVNHGPKLIVEEELEVENDISM
jgi:hypothetical protein